jgi:hypothetical protein
MKTNVRTDGGIEAMTGLTKSALGVVMLLTGIAVGLGTSIVFETFPLDVFDAELLPTALAWVSWLLLLLGSGLLHQHWWSEGPRRRPRR